MLIIMFKMCVIVVYLTSTEWYFTAILRFKRFPTLLNLLDLPVVDEVLRFFLLSR